jgi:protoheme IX farnesyltransferase
MKSAATTVCAEAPAWTRTRFADYVELTKPRVLVLVLFTVVAGALLASGSSPNWSVMLHALLGTALVAAGASALNQLLERDSDLLMRRTENRPLPGGRLQPIEVLVFGLSLGIAGIVYLAAVLQQPLAAGTAAVTFLSYVLIYTPLKRLTTLNTIVGAVPGALPPVIGWAAVRGTLNLEVVPLFAIIFLWQVPHFLAIAWIYREEYAAAGLRMLPVVDRDGSATGRQMVSYSLTLVPVSLTPVLLGGAGVIYLAGALALSLGFLAFAIVFARRRDRPHARGVLKASLVYLPLLLALLLLDGAARG